MEFQKIFFINNRNSKNEYSIPNDKQIETNNCKNNNLLTKVNSNMKIPNPNLNQKIYNKYTIFKNKHLNLNNKNLLNRTLSFRTIENNEINNKNNIKTSRYSVIKQINDSNSSTNFKSMKSINGNKNLKRNYPKELDNNGIDQINQIFKQKGNISYKRDMKIDINNNTENKEIKNIVSILTSKNKILKRNIIPNLKNFNVFNKNSNNSYYNTKKPITHNYSNLVSSKNSASKSNMKNKNEKEILKFEKKKLKVHLIPGILNQKTHLNFNNNIKVETSNNY